MCITKMPFVLTDIVISCLQLTFNQTKDGCLLMPEFLSETPQSSAVYRIDHSRVRTIDQGTLHANVIALINKLQQKYAFNVY